MPTVYKRGSLVSKDQSDSQLCTEGEVWRMRSTLPVPTVYRREGLENEEYSARASCVQRGRFCESGALLE